MPAIQVAGRSSIIRDARRPAGCQLGPAVCRPGLFKVFPRLAGSHREPWQRLGSGSHVAPAAQVGKGRARGSQVVLGG